MLQQTVETVLMGVGLYLAVGLLFALIFAFKGVGRIDRSAREPTIGFRLVVIPAAAVFWPLLAQRWRRGTLPPEEHNAHRDASRPREKA